MMKDRGSAAFRRSADNTSRAASGRYSQPRRQRLGRGGVGPDRIMARVLKTIWRRSSIPWIWSAWGGCKGPRPVRPRPHQQLRHHVGAGVDQHPGGAVIARSSTRSEQRRRQFFGFQGSQSPQRSPRRGTPPDDPQPRIVARIIGGPGEKAGRNSPWSGRRIRPHPSPAPRRRRGQYGRHRPVRCGGRDAAAAPDGGVGLDQDAVAGAAAKISRISAERGKAAIPDIDR